MRSRKSGVWIFVKVMARRVWTAAAKAQESSGSAPAGGAVTAALVVRAAKLSVAVSASWR